MKKKTINRCFVTGMGLMITGLLFFDGIPADIYKGHLDFSSQETSVSMKEKITKKQEVHKILDMDIYEAKQFMEEADHEIESDEEVYTFSQGPVAWQTGRVWSGQWGDTSVDGNRFGAFGCGFCCMANIYCTLTEYKASPLDVYSYAKEITYYTPSIGSAAISWNYMKQVLDNMGMETELKNKTLDITDFQNDAKQSKVMIVLVNSNEDNSFWKDTPGHYVTIWRYDEKDKTVLVGDSGDPDRNRQRIKLKTVYKALKMASEYQYLIVTDYKEENNNWKWDQITENWIAPQ